MRAGRRIFKRLTRKHTRAKLVNKGWHSTPNRNKAPKS